MALRCLARRARVPGAAVAAALRPPQGRRVLSPPAAGSRCLTTKDGHNKLWEDFEALHMHLYGESFKSKYDQLFREDSKDFEGKGLDEEKLAELAAKLKALRGDLEEPRYHKSRRLCLMVSAAAVIFGLEVLVFGAGYSDGTQRAAARYLQVCFNALEAKIDEAERLQSEIQRLKKENTSFRGIVQALAEQGGLDYDALIQQAAPESGGTSNGAKVERSFGEDVKTTVQEEDEEESAAADATVEAVLKALSELVRPPSVKKITEDPQHSQGRY
ncbi:hypothetical protein ACP70R_014494 [Stipagrostis hirtigluma subsp. patula]